MSCQVTGNAIICSIKNSANVLFSFSSRFIMKTTNIAKLYFAGKAQNWLLAEFELHEVEENLGRAVALRPEEHGTNLVGLNDGFKQTQLAALRTATQLKDWNAFQSAYSEAVGVCNGCHEETARPFIVITVPAAPPVPNQQWEPPVLSSEK
jgi:hypothetical protein